MNFLFISFLQAAEGAAKPQGSMGSFWIMMILIFVVMWLLFIRPQQKEQKKLEQLRSELKKGDKVVTIGGINGTVDEAKEGDPTVLVKVDGEVKLRFDRAAIAKVNAEAPQQK